MLIDLPSTRPVFAYAQDYLHGERVGCTGIRARN